MTGLIGSWDGSSFNHPHLHPETGERELDIVIIAVTAACTAIGSFATGYALSAIQHRRSLKDAGKTEVVTQARLAKFEVARKVNGMLRNLSHELMHSWQRTGGDVDFHYRQAKKIISAIREFARSESYILGENYVTQVHRTTDIADLCMQILTLKERELKSEPDLMDRFRALRDNERSYRFAIEASEVDYLYFLYRDNLDRLSSIADWNNP